MSRCFLTITCIYLEIYKNFYKQPVTIERAFAGIRRNVCDDIINLIYLNTSTYTYSDNYLPWITHDLWDSNQIYYQLDQQTSPTVLLGLNIWVLQFIVYIHQKGLTSSVGSQKYVLVQSSKQVITLAVFN